MGQGEATTVEIPHTSVPHKGRWSRRRKKIQSNECKWISGGFFSVMAILFLVYIFSNLDDSETFSNLVSGGPEPLCKTKGEFMDNVTEQCFKMMTRGPCNEDLVFMPDEPDKIYGSCNCPYMFFNRTVLYHEGQCHFIFTQAYCPDGHWLTVTNTGEPICEVNLCLSLNHSNHGLIDQEWVPLRGGECAQLGKPVEGCPSGSVVRFHENYIFPSCLEPPISEPWRYEIGAIGVTKYVTCPLGSHRSIVGKCQPKFQFDWDY